MASERPKSFGADFRVFFFRGLAILLPSILTLWLLVYAFLFVQRSVAEPINSGVRRAVLFAAPKFVENDRLPDWFTVTPEQITRLRFERAREARPALSDAELRSQARERNLTEWWNSRWYLRLIGLVIAIVLIYLAGRFLGGLIGRRVYNKIESFFHRIPVVAHIYPHVKQVVEFLMGGEERIKFSRVVLVEYPRKGIWTVGLLTGESMRAIEAQMDTDAVTIFIPSSPTPFTGYTITVPKEEAIELPISIDEALRFVVSGGVLIPPRELPEGAKGQPPTGDLAGAGSDAIMAPPEEGAGSEDEPDQKDSKRAG